MFVRVTSLLLALPLLLTCTQGLADEVLFEDNFNQGLSDQWELVGLEKKDYRIRDGALELRVQPGELAPTTPMLKVMLPFSSHDTVVASVAVSIVDEFTKSGEFAGLFLLNEGSREFAAKKERIGDKLVFAPGNYRFQGQPGQEGAADQYVILHAVAVDEAGPLRIVVDRGYAFFQVGPSKEGQYRTYFHSAIQEGAPVRGFALTAAGAPAQAAHWVRFDNFRILKRG